MSWHVITRTGVDVFAAISLIVAPSVIILPFIPTLNFFKYCFKISSC
uniref:Uncharacterized protein n=1 Tax=virus sp. ctx9V1 TaxID=2828001 RepID=A0A8S5RE26_9VIRU|nr:MAG TPA: hypothetical protein [virus sp. ctx9V1]